MFLHIISILLHKIHPYFSLYAAYLRNMRIIKKVSSMVSTSTRETAPAADQILSTEEETLSSAVVT